jgi:hypothetical protein
MPRREADETAANRRGRGGNTTWSQRIAILEWLEMPPGDNFRLITGAATTTMRSVVAGVKLTKDTAYAELAEYVNQTRGAKWDKKQAESRFRAYLKLFKETKRKYLNPCGEKYCISAADEAKGIFTIEMKLDVDCPYYSRMDKLFGERQNIQPTYIMEPGRVVAPSVTTISNTDGADEEASVEENNDEEREEDPASVASQERLSTLSSDTSVILTPPLTIPPPRKRSVQANPFPDDLVSKCEASVAATLQGNQKVSIQKKLKKDGISSFADVKIKELELMSSRLEWEKLQEEKRSETDLRLKDIDLRMKEADLKLKETVALGELKNKDKEIEAATKRALLVSLVAAGKSPEEIKQYLSVLA